MKPLLPIVFLLIMAHSVFGQTSDSLYINNIGANISVGGKLFGTEDGSNYGLYYPLSENVNNSTVYAGGYWLGGVDQEGVLHVAAQTYNQLGFDYWSGPVATNYDAVYDNRYNRVWSINRDEINNHLLNNNSPGYVMPEVIENWPAHGNVANGEPYYLAPFVDVNSDGVYHPEQGDYPLINGDKAVYFIINDARLPHTESGGNSFGVDIYSMAYAYNTPDIPYLYNSVFLNTRIVNRSEQTYDLHFGMWLDVDMGVFYNDAVGCDTLLNMFYGYNRDTISEVMLENGLPAQGCMILNKQLYAHITGVSGISSELGTINTPSSYLNLLSGLWANGAIVTQGGNGSGGDTATRYMFSGDPFTNEGWTFLNVDPPFLPFDTRAVGSITPFTLSPNEQICIDVAFPAAQAPEGSSMPDHIAAIAQLKEFAQQIQYWYNASFDNCAIDVMTNVLHDDTVQPKMQITVRYDMASRSAIFNINNPYQEQANIQLLNLEGKIAKNYQPMLQIGSNALNLSLNGMPHGVYIVSISTPTSNWRGKIILPF